VNYPSPSSGGSLPSTLQRLLRTVDQFLKVETVGAVLLLIATITALVWANAAESSYTAFWHTDLTHGRGPELLARPLHFWVNDGLMTLFFLLVGLEIRAEAHDGVLALPRQAVLPVVAALGGVNVPAIIIIGLNFSDPAMRRGWAIPMATDIAFSAGALTLLGKRVPQSLRILLLTLAIVDDIAAVLVIALFYSNGIAWEGLVLAAGGAASVLGLQVSGVRQVLAYVVPGFVIWIGLLHAGIHPTLAGVILGIMTTPVGRLKDVLHPWVALAVMPLFALANAGIFVGGRGAAGADSPRRVVGVLVGVVIGKPVGILLASVLIVKCGAAQLPPDIRWRHLAVLGCLGGIGFTMSIFLADLAFPPGHLVTTSKLAILLASALAAVIGLVLGRCALPNPTAAPGPWSHPTHRPGG
jgi:NhaA family Na+:H+ antiporter